MIPAASGTYALLLSCPRARTLRIGRLGDHRVPRGWYIYVGSAFGPGGLQSRCRRHLRPLNRRHWHIDYLRPAAFLTGLWFTTDPVPREHQWSEMIVDLPGASVPVPGFGSSDCRCRSHLFHFASNLAFATFWQRAQQRAPAAIMFFPVATARQSRRDAL